MITAVLVKTSVRIAGRPVAVGNGKVPARTVGIFDEFFTQETRRRDGFGRNGAAFRPFFRNRGAVPFFVRARKYDLPFIFAENQRAVFNRDVPFESRAVESAGAVEQAGRAEVEPKPRFHAVERLARLKRGNLLRGKRFGIDARVFNLADKDVALILNMARTNEDGRALVKSLRRVDFITRGKLVAAVYFDGRSAIDNTDADEFPVRLALFKPTVLLLLCAAIPRTSRHPCIGSQFGKDDRVERVGIRHIEGQRAPAALFQRRGSDPGDERLIAQLAGTVCARKRRDAAD